ncbi:MAG: caspase family protein [Syntrophobacterales bacterium]|nr:caspase family protein [Syntrophobacterales bacterium]
MRSKRWIWLIILTCLVSTSLSLANQPSSEPILKIHSPTHTASIRKVKSDLLGTYLVTASYDQTVKVWDASTGDVLSTLHPPIGDGNEGKIYAAALSSDGKHVACGGFTGKQWDGKFAVYIFDWHSGSMIRRLGGLPEAILDIAYSPNGKYLVVALAKKQGIRVYNAENYGVVFEDFHYGGSAYGVDFDKKGRLTVVSDDGFIRLYDSNLSLVAKQKTSGKAPFSVAFNQDGSLIAVGYMDIAKVDIFSGENLKLLFSPSTQGISSGNLSSVAWLSNGNLCAAGRWSLSNGINPIRCWENGGKGPYRDISTGSRDTILGLKALPGNQLVFISGDPSVGKIGKDGSVVFMHSPTNADFRDKQDDFLINADGSQVVFGFFWSDTNAKGLFSISERFLEVNPKKMDGFKPPITKGLPVTNWKGSDKPLFRDKPIPLDPYERSYCLAISPDLQGFVIGSEWSLRLFDSNGVQKWKVTAPSPVRAVNITSDRRIVVAAYADGTIRWHRLRDGTLVMSLFFIPKTGQWVLWAPSGYYDASAGAEDYIGWHINRGTDKEADFFPISRFRSVYYRPDLPTALIKTLDEKEALRFAEKEWGRSARDVKPTEVLPPVVRILSPPKNYETDSKELKMKISLRSPSNAPVRSVKVLIDGRPVRVEEGEWAAGEEVTREITIPLEPREQSISVIAINKYGASEPSIIRVSYGTKVGKADAFPEEKPTAILLMPKLYILAVGVGKYPNEEMKLLFPAKDAQDFVKTMESQKGKLYRDVVAKILIDEKATRENIVDGLEWIRKETTARDVAMIFLAGHGFTDNRNQVYYYMPIDANPDKLMGTAVSAKTLQETISSIPGKVILFLDTCYAANVLGGKAARGLAVGATNDVIGVANELSSSENGAVVFASSFKTQKSFESPDWGNGAFTKALIEGISGKADLMGKGKVTIKTLEIYISDRVKDLTKGDQTPVIQAPEKTDKGIVDFPIAVVEKI